MGCDGLLRFFEGFFFGGMCGGGGGEELVRGGGLFFTFLFSLSFLLGC